MLARSGAVVPANLDVAFSPAFAQRGLRPRSVGIFRDSQARSGLMPYTSAWDEVAARVVRSGSGIRLRTTRPAAIRRAVQTVLGDPSYRERALELQAELAEMDGARSISEALTRPPATKYEAPGSCRPR